VRIGNILFGVYVVLCVVALTWPAYDALGNRIEPFVLGVPFVFAWNVVWVLLTFVALFLYDLTRGRG